MTDKVLAIWATWWMVKARKVRSRWKTVRMIQGWGFKKLQHPPATN